MLDWSFDLLSPDLQTFSASLSVFPEVSLLPEAEVRLYGENIQAGLLALVDQSLLEQHPHRMVKPYFQMLGIVREYALEKAGMRLMRMKNVVTDSTNFLTKKLFSPIMQLNVQHKDITYEYHCH